MKRYLFLILLGVVLVYSQQSYAENTEKALSQVKVVINADDDIKPSITTYIDRELSALKNVSIVDKEDYNWKISIIAMKITSNRGNVLGIAYSVVVINRVEKSSSLSLCLDSAGLTADQSSTVRKMLQSFIYRDALLGNTLMISSPDEVEDTCKKIIADFDTSLLSASQTKIADDQLSQTK